MGQWFMDIDQTWHIAAWGRIAQCGALAGDTTPWTQRPPRGHVICADCADDAGVD